PALIYIYIYAVTDNCCYWDGIHRFRRTHRTAALLHEKRMRLPVAATALALTTAVATASVPASAATFRFGFQGDLKSLDSYTLNETFTLGLLGNVYEGLTKRDKNLEIVPGLAERWEVLDPTRWRFYLRKGVKFHNGEDFTADDVVFSAERVRANGSDLKTRLPADARAGKVDDYTVDFLLSRSNPILNFRA